MEPDHSEPAVRGSKRRRVALACDSCRTRKSRCDGNQPSCTVCTNLGFECNYTTPSTAVNVLVGKEYLRSLESRISILEESLTSLRSGPAISVRQDVNLVSPESNDIVVPSLPEAEPPTPEGPSLVHTNDSIDAMGAVVFADEEDSGFFGPSSNIAFLRHFSCTGANPIVSSSEKTKPFLSPFQGGFINKSRPSSPITRGLAHQSGQSPVDIFFLPPAEEISALVRSFFLDSGLLFPYIHPPTFLKPFQHVLDRNVQKLRRTWLGLLNMIFAMVKTTEAPGTRPANVRMAEANVFYQRAMGLCGSEIMRGTTIEVVQLLLLMGQYLQGTQNPVQAWTSHGLAVKAALQLGLQSRNASQAFSLLEQEIRKRTWYECVVLDRTLSMTLGRPATIPESYVQLDLPQLEPEDTVEGLVHIEDLKLSTSFFNFTILLYKHLFSVIDQLYGQNLGCQPTLSIAECVSRILNVGQDLALWESSLPNALRIITLQEIREAKNPPPADGPQFQLKFRIILTLRYHHLQTMLHRPILAEYLKACASANMKTTTTTKTGVDKNLADKRLLQQIGYNSLQVCSEAAMNIIDIIHEALSCDSSCHAYSLGAWWFSLYYIFHSALVLLATVRIHKLSATTTATSANSIGKSMPFTIDQLLPYQVKAVEAICRLDSENRIVDRCRYYLERLSDLIHSPDNDAGQINLDTSDPNFDFTSPLGLEFGEFMLDDDFWAVVNQQGQGVLQIESQPIHSSSTG